MHVLLSNKTNVRAYCRHNTLAVILVCVLCAVSSLPVSGQQQSAELVLVGGNIYTVDRARPHAQAIAVDDGRIVAIGSNQTISAYVGSDTQVIDLKGQFAMPGFIEGHAHFVGLGESMMMLNLHQAKTWDEIVLQVEKATRTTPPGEWIIGRGWHQSKWDHVPSPNVNGYPTNLEMNSAAPDHPVLLTHASGHMSFANEYAMKLAGVDANTENPKGGEIVKDENGKPIGIFRETAQALIQKVKTRADNQRPQIQKQAYSQRAVELASIECLKKGITSFQDAGSSLATVRNLRKLADEGKLGVRLWVMIRDDNERLRGQLANYKMIGYADQFLTCRALKRSIDGALGAHGAWLLAPYQDLPTSSGLNTASIDSVTETAKLGIKNDFQVCVHAIGDRANREVLNIYEKMFKEFPSQFPRRWRIEHAQHLHPDDIPRFGKLGVIASMQGIHCTSDAIFVPQRLGMRRSEEGAYVWKSLVDSGAIVTNGTDAPVEDVDPIASFYASVTRRLTDKFTFFPGQVLTREQAIRSYTIDNAYAAFEENTKGSLVPGKLADIVVLNNDLIQCDAEEIKNTRVIMTIIDGRIAYQAEKSPNHPE
ncbi:amidohydrolase [Mariniblastus sp.]|nr:amidohydrolase [bacterium]MDA7904016.1 amidohydrolase [Mariniblastus sp.]MDA7905697.1 amidohydrolase [Mariniblastus sp.]MDB4385997.1 amidohydrolase [bacterium]MDC0294819.1 amidohydrolase [Mariniblastus sp.]